MSHAHGVPFPCSVGACSHGCVNIRMGPMSLHLDQAEFSSMLAAMLATAEKMGIVAPKAGDHSPRDFPH